MKYEELKQEIKEISTIAESVPEAFREKCFELLLNKVLARETRHKPAEDAQDKQEEKRELDKGRRDSSGLDLPGQVKAFMRRRDITSEQIQALLMIEDGEVSRRADLTNRHPTPAIADRHLFETNDLLTENGSNSRRALRT